MNAELIGTIVDSATQIYSLAAVAKNYTDSNYENEKMLHIGLMVDKIYEQASRLKILLDDKKTS